MRDNTIGGSIAGSANTISGNQLYGIQISTGSADNKVWGNQIGTGLSGLTAIPNNSDGVFLIDATNNQIGGLDPNQGNTISGNRGDGIGIFGTSATGNRVANNLIGLGKDGTSIVPNRGSGVLIDNAGGDKPDLNMIGPGNIVSGNNQSGITVSSTLGPLAAGNLIVGNKIGTDKSGTLKAANGGNGVFLFGASRNTIGGQADNGNLISGNALSGVLIFSPAGEAPADNNVVLGNRIGTSADGQTPLANQADGIQIINGSNNMIGAGNLISGNLASGVEIDQQTLRKATGNIITGNFIGVRADGNTALTGSTQQFGVLVSNAQGNAIGSAGGATVPGTNVPQTPSNVISGNKQAGIDIVGSATANLVLGNYIGVNSSGLVGLAAANLGNTVGVLVDNSSGNFIGGSAPGAGNIISQSAVSSIDTSLTGILIQGPPTATNPNTLVQGNLIGLDKNNQPAANEFGVRIVNSANNVIGFRPNLDGPVNLASSTVGARNIISGNSIAGVQVTGSRLTNNLISGNYVGTDPTGTRLIQATGATGYQEFAKLINDRPDPKTHAVVPTQQTGVLIDQASSNLIGSSAAGSGNLISGNEIGVDIEGAAGDVNKGALNVVQNNLIGTDFSGMSALPNFEYGVNINGSPQNLIATNVISANGVAGVLIFGGAGKNTNAVPLGNTIVGNKIGTNLNGGLSYPASAAVDMSQHPQILNPSTDGDLKHFLPSYLGFQLHGVVIIGSAGNNIGPGPKDNPSRKSNLISGNILTGIYLTSHDFNGNTFAQPFGNPIRFNTIARNGMYGAYRFDAPAGSNPVVVRGKGKNMVSGNPQSIGDFVTGFSDKATVQANPQSLLLPGRFGVPVNPFVPANGAGSGPKRGRKTKRVRVPKVVHKTPKPTKTVVTGSARSTGHHTTQSAVAHSAQSLARTRVPALIRPGAKLIRVNHPAIKTGK